MKIVTEKCRSRSFRNGTSTVEFALVLPIMLLLLFGAIEFARASQVVNAAAFSAYQGCRMAIIPGGSATAATAATQQVLAAMSIGSATISVTPSPILDDTAVVTVLVSIPLDNVGWIAPMFTGGKTITRGCTLTRETTNQSSAAFQDILATPPPAPAPAPTPAPAPAPVSAPSS